jgi:superfamily II DNA or RNA helicase
MYEIFEKLGQEEIKLRPLQKIALESCRDVFRSGIKRFVLKATCGFGKTVLSAYFIKKAVKKGVRCLFVVDRIVLAEQTDKVFSKYGIFCGIQQADNPKWFPDRMVQIGSIQTLNRRDIDQYGLIIIDECHCHYSGHTKLLEANKESFVIGLSSTPYSKSLGKYYQALIEPITVKDMVKHKELVPFDIYGPSIADLSKLKIRAGEYTEDSLSEVYDQVDIIGDVVKQWKKLTPGKKTIVFGVNVAHIKHISKEFNKQGISACQINAYQPQIERQEALDGFIYGDTTVLCSVEVATKGFDCAAVEVVVLAVATKSHIKWEQTCGRSYRLYPGKEKAIILDLGGNTERLDFPDSYNFYELDNGKKYKSKLKKKERPELKPKACPSCDFVKPPGMRKCIACGFIPDYIADVETAKGELKKLQRKAKKEYTLAQKQSFLSQLNQHCENKKYKVGKNGCYGWSIHKYIKKFGARPSNKIRWNLKEPIGDEVRRFLLHLNIIYGNRKKKK